MLNDTQVDVMMSACTRKASRAEALFIESGGTQESPAFLSDPLVLTSRDVSLLR